MRADARARSPHTLTSANNLGMLLKDQGKLDLAEPFLCRSLEGCERTLGRDHPDTLASVNNMGALLVAQGKSSLAEPFFRRALEAWERTLGRDHPNTLTAAENLAVLPQAIRLDAIRTRYYKS